MFDQIGLDARAGRFGSWALSTVIDENIDAPVITRPEFDALHAAAGLTAEWPVGNAGLLHVYGYLLSTVPTPFGLKGDRWLDGALAAALGLCPGAFRLADASSAGDTVLHRVTDAVLPHLEDPSPGRGDILSFDDAVPGTDRFFRTTVVRRSAGAGTALVYGVQENGSMRAVTAFPVASAAPAALEALQAEPARMRYNAVLAGLPARSPLVRRR